MVTSVSNETNGANIIACEANTGTVAVWAGEHAHRVQGSAAFPIFQAATFQYRGEKEYGAIRYTRCNNTPNQLVLADKLAALEGTEAAMVTSSGMAAISTTLLTFLSPGDHLIITQPLYGGTHDFINKDLLKLGVTASKVDAQQPQSWGAALKSSTKIFYTETISNPTVDIGDLEAVVQFSKKHKLLSIIDSTFATPVLFRPVKDWGFDIVLHSATKYLNGHSDVIAGVFAGRRVLINQIIDKLNHLGGSLDPHACFLLQRGLKTLSLRVKQQCKNALALASFLEAQPEVSEVFYPALKSSPRHARVARLLGGHAGGVFSFQLAAGVEAADIFLDSLEYALNAPSLGGVETLITRPATTSHAGLTEEELKEAGIAEGLIRVAVGVEDTEDLVSDFKQALRKARR